MFLTSCQSQSKYSTCRFRNRSVVDSSPLFDPKRQPRPSPADVATCSLQAFVHFPLSQVFRLHVSRIFDSPHFHDGQLPACHVLLHPQDLGMEMSHSPPLRASRQSPLTLWRPLVHVASPPLTCQQPSPLRPELSMHSCLTRKTQLRLSLSPPHSELLPTAHAAQSLSEKTRNRARRWRACKFLIFGCCIRLASSFTANCRSDLS